MAFAKGRVNEPWRVHWTDYKGHARSIVKPTRGLARGLLREVRKIDPKAWMEKA